MKQLYFILLLLFIVQTYGQNTESATWETTTSQNSEAEFPGGKKAMDAYIINNVTFNTTENIKGGSKVFIQYSISEKGEVSVINCKAISSNLTAAVTKVFEGMPKWKPAYRYGKPVTKSYSYQYEVLFR